MSNDSFKTAVNALLTFHGTLESKHETIAAVTGHPDGTVAVPNMDNYIYCRLQGDDSKTVRAFNKTVPNNVANLVVDLEIIKDAQGRVTGYTVLGTSSGIQYLAAPSTSVPVASLPPHHRTHEAARTGGGYDMVNVYEEAIVALRGNAQSPATLKVNVSRGTYWINGVRYYYAGGESPAFNPDGDSIDVLCIDSTGTLSIIAGTHGSWGGGAGGYGGGGGTSPTFPTITAGLVPVAAINLTATLTAINEGNFGADPRPFVTAPGALTGSGVAGRVAIWTSATNVGSDAGLTYNSATDALTVGGTLSVGSSLVTGTSGNLTIAGTAGKTLSLIFADNYSLTIPATGTAALGTGTATRVAYWSGTNTLTSSAGLTYDGATSTLTASNLVVSTAATFSARTATRVAYFGVAGLLTDSANLTFDGSSLFISGVGFGGTAGNLLIAGAAGKTLSFSFTDSWILTVAASGTVTTGTGVANRVTYWGGTNSLTSNAAFTFNGTDTILLGNATLRGVSGGLTVSVTNTKILTLAAADDYTLTVPATGVAALLATANVFTANQTISNTAPSLTLTDTTAAAKSLTIAVDANLADLRESAGAQGSLLVLDLANNRVGIGMNPTVALDVTGAAKVSSTLTVGSSVITGTSGNLTIAVTAAKTLSLAAADNYTLTVPATGTVPLGTGTNTHVAYWSGTNDLTGSSYLTFNGSQVKIGSGSDAAGVTAQLYVTLNGTTNLSIRDSTNDVELLNFVSSAGGVIGTFTNHSLAIRTNNTLGISIDTSQNVGITTSTFGTSAAGVLAVFNRTAPTTGPADTVQFYSSDDSAGNTVPSFYCEGTGVVATGQADSASSVRVKMRINGTVRTFLCI